MNTLSLLQKIFVFWIGAGRHWYSQEDHNFERPHCSSAGVIAWGKHTHVILDVGCSVDSFRGYVVHLGGVTGTEPAGRPYFSCKRWRREQEDAVGFHCALDGDASLGLCCPLAGSLKVSLKRVSIDGGSGSAMFREMLAPSPNRCRRIFYYISDVGKRFVRL
jgi:hypothetical protein